MSSSGEYIPKGGEQSSDSSSNEDLVSSPSTSGPSRGRVMSKNQARKRKATEDGPAKSRSRVKRLKPMYSTQYRQLYNDTIKDLNFEKLPRAAGRLRTSQIGISMWSVEEKSALFRTIARSGRGDVQSLVAAIRSKSEPETCVYLELLHHEAAKRELGTGDRRNMFDVSSIEPAVEIGPECHDALEGAADALSTLQYREEERIEKENFPQTWLLTSSIAKWADRGLRTGGEQEQEVLNALPAAELLSLRNFLTLSKQIFMNSSNLDGNWRSYAERRRVPSLFQTAFSDFHALTVSLTKRLVSSALFLASSRIRAETSEHVNPKATVRRKDVLAALEVLGVSPNSKQTWIGVARKCNLRIYENVRNKRAWGKRYDYDEVEQHLATYDNRRGRYRSRTRSPSFSNGELSQPASDNALQSEQSDGMPDESSSTNDTRSPSRSSLEDNDSGDLDPPSPADQSSRQEQQDLLQDAYMEGLDRRAGQIEQCRLWELLGEDPAKKMSLDDIEVLEKPAPPSKTKEDFVDWRDWVDYAAEWETLETPVPEESFRANRLLGRKRRCRGFEADSSPSDTGSEGDFVGGEDNAEDSGSNLLPEEDDGEDS